VSTEERAAAVRAAIAEANARGVTSVQTADGDADALELYDAIRRAGDLTVRIYAAAPVARPLADADLDALDRVRREYPDDPLLKVGAISIALDGPLGVRAAALLEPYELADGPVGAGSTAFTPDELNRTVRLADAAGWQVIIEASGDRAVRMALTAYAHAARSNRPPAHGRRHRISGLALTDPADVPRFEPLGVLASVQPCQAMPTSAAMESLQRAVGAERAARAFAFRTMARATRTVFGSGWPSCDLDPLVGLHVATRRTALDDTPEGGWQPAERLQRTTAIDAYTSSAAWGSFDEQRKGSIAAGMLADLVVLSSDLLGEKAKDLSAVRVTHTIFDGKVVHRLAPRSETEPVPSLQH
jgi:predicted amidohydrolase YtcJ